MNTPITKKVQDAMGARAAAAAGKQTKKAGVSGNSGNTVYQTLKKLDVATNQPKVKPAVKEGSMQEFVEYGPGPAIRRGIESGKKAFGKLTGSTYGTSIK